MSRHSRSPSPQNARALLARSLYRAAADDASASPAQQHSGDDSVPDCFLTQVHQAWSRSGSSLTAKLGFPGDVALLAVAACVANSDELSTCRMAIRAQQLWDSRQPAGSDPDACAAMFQDFLALSSDQLPAN